QPQRRARARVAYRDPFKTLEFAAARVYQRARFFRSRTRAPSDRIRALINPRVPQEVFAMRKRVTAFAALFVLTTSTIQFAQTGVNAPRYLMPPKEVVEAFDAPALPTAMLSPSKQVIALSYRR